MYVDTPDHSKQRITSMVLMIRDVVLYSNSIGKKTYENFVCDPDEFALVPRAVELLKTIFPDSVITSRPHMESRLIKITIDWSEGDHSLLPSTTSDDCTEKERRNTSITSDEVEFSASMCELTDT